MSNISNAPALREAADLLDAHPGLPRPYITTRSDGTVNVAWYLSIEAGDLTGQKDTAASIVRAIGGKWDKAQVGEVFNFTRSLGLLSLCVQVERPAVCERVVIGTEKRTIPGKPAQPERVEEVEKVEWRCKPLLTDDDRDAA